VILGNWCLAARRTPSLPARGWKRGRAADSQTRARFASAIFPFYFRVIYKDRFGRVSVSLKKLMAFLAGPFRNLDLAKQFLLFLF
jgi:hypothetical protein